MVLRDLALPCPPTPREFAKLRMRSHFCESGGDAGRPDTGSCCERLLVGCRGSAVNWKDIGKNAQNPRSRFSEHREAINR